MSNNHDTEALGAKRRLRKEMEQEQQRIRRILDGRSDEYGYFVRTYSAQVLDFVSRMVSDAGDAEELAQDAFVRAFHSLGQFDGRSSWLTWVLRIAYNTALNHLKRQRQQWLSIDDLPLSRMLRYYRSEPTTDDDLSTDREERIQQLDAAIGRLPADEQLLLHLYYYDDRQLRDIAYIMDAEPGLLATRLHRIRKKLLLMLKD